MKFLFVCGGTAGHINPALAIAGELRNMLPDAEFLFIGSGRQLENRLVPQAGFKIENISSGGFTRGLSLGGIAANLKSAAKLLLGMHQASQIVRKFKPDAVIGTGGYVCYPVLSAAAGMGIPTVIHESNAIPGMTTKLVSGKVDKVMVSFPGMERMFKKPERVVFTGTPVRQGFFSKENDETKSIIGSSDRPLVVSFWGSLGAEHMNEIMADFIKLNTQNGAFTHIHATGNGEAGVRAMRRALAERGITEIPELLDLRPYIDDMPAVMSAADLVLCRAGASTLGELTAIGKPAVLVPSPNVTDNHQEKNARALEETGGAVMLREQDCTGQLLYGTVSELVSDPATLRQMSEKLKVMGTMDSAEKIAGIILGMC